MTETAQVRLPRKLVKVFRKPRGSVRYRCAHGGRGSGKSFGFAKMAATFGVVEGLRFLCGRELQGSIKESFYAELKNAIASEPWLEAAYDVGVDYIRSRINSTEFLFKGLRHNLGSVKSMAQIDICILEEAEDIPEESWLALEPTIRAPKSEIWVIWNPRTENSPVDTRFIKTQDPDAVCVEMNYTDNPWFPQVLETLRAKQQKSLEPEMYAHIWLGKYLKHSKATIFAKKWRVDTLQTGSDWNGPYFGLDFGFANDPTAAVKCWISPDETTLYIERECGRVGLELDETAQYLIDRLPGVVTHTMLADNARPESISLLKRRAPGRPNLPLIEATTKGPGSVEDGIEHMKTFDIVVHPDCTEMQNEFTLYSYKVDRLTGDVLPVIVDANNHYVDATRYALEKVMKAKQTGGLMIPARHVRG